MSADLHLESTAAPAAAAPDRAATAWAPSRRREAAAASPETPATAPASPWAVAWRLPAWVVRTHWRGDLPWWAVVPLAWALALGMSRGWAIAWDALPATPSHALQVGLLAGELAVRGLLLAWMGVGLLRALRHHVGEAASWGLAAIALAALAPLGLEQGRELRVTHCLLSDALARGDGAPAAARVEVTTRGTVLQVHGPVGPGLAGRVRDALAAAPRVHIVSLAGPGGLFHEADAIARLLVARGVDTVVDGECASACVHMFAAGRTRWLGPEARVGLHRAGHACTPTPANAPATTTDRRLAQFLEERGVAAWFAERVLATPFESLWVPSRDDLVVSGLATLRTPR
jgi:hypothetical protein